MPKFKDYFMNENTLMKHLIYKGPNKLKYKLNIGLERTNHTYFSFTIDIYKNNKDIGGGASHELMVKILPELKKYINLHLSDENGVPLYALENGFYYLQRPKEYNFKVVAKHFRINDNEAKKLQNDVNSNKLNKDDIEKYVNNQKNRWKKEASQAIKWIKSLDDSKEYTTNINN